MCIRDRRFTKSIDVKPGNTYYFELTHFIGKVKTEPIDEKKGKEIFDGNKTTIQGEEDINNPIGKISAASLTSGPKQGSCFVLSKQGYLPVSYTHLMSV